tara:strand:+ start:3815 stop:4063 length:249 start_codon:yes stop_codon:yes gene_type:complete
MSRTPDEIREVGIARFKFLARDKYDRGQKEHGGLLDETVTIEKLEEEAIDLWFYAQSLRVKHANEVKALEEVAERWEDRAKR